MNKNDYDIFQRRLLSWYDAHARVLPWRDEPTPYRVWISEIMLQQTRVDTVKPYFERFLKDLPTVNALAEVTDEKLMKLWEGLGYYSRARNLKKAAQLIELEYGGQLPGKIEALLKLPGIGPYTAGAVGSIAFGIRGTAVDGNVNRVITRLTGNRQDISNPKIKKEIERFTFELLPMERVGDFNQALMELGATVCLPNGQPKCEKCPVNELCEGYTLGIAAEIPLKVKKKAKKIEEKTIFIIEHNGKIAIRQRPMEGLLSGLWEFPNLDGLYSEEECADIMANWGIQYSRLIPLEKAKHIFSHIEWHMIGYYILAEWIQDKVQEDELNFAGSLEQGKLIFAKKDEIKKIYSIPTAFKAYQNIL